MSEIIQVPDKIKSCPCCGSRLLNFYMHNSFPKSGGMIQQQMIECTQCGCSAPLSSWQSRNAETPQKGRDDE